MMESPHGELSVTVGAEGPSIVLAFEGELDLASAPFARTVVESIFADPPPRVVLDLAALRFMDTNGIDLLNRCAALGRRFRCLVEHRGATGMVARLLAMPAVDVLVPAELPAFSWN